MTSTFPLYAAALGIGLPGMIQRETNKAKYRAADRQASYREKKNGSAGKNITAPILAVKGGAYGRL